MDGHMDGHTTFEIEMSPPIYFHWVGSIQSISKNKNSFGNFEKFSKQLWNSHLSNFYRLEMTEVRIQSVISRCGKRGHIIDFFKLHVVFLLFPISKQIMLEIRDFHSLKDLSLNFLKIIYFLYFKEKEV